ncbi:MAG: thiol peroxidase [Vulcanimicrobiaceae bacterium]
MATQSIPERAAAVTFRGSPMTLVGSELRAGDPAPAFTLSTTSLEPYTLETATDGGKRAVLLIVVPSLDTGVCSKETDTFYRRLGELPAGVVAAVVSLDLPFAQARWAAEHGVEGLVFLSAYREHDFGASYGVLIKELGLLARSEFVIGKDMTLAYAHVVPEVAEEPDYDATLAAAAKAAKA